MDGAIDEAIGYLCRTHDATGRQGSSRGWSLLFGWTAAFPETTGYIIGTLLARADGRPELLQRAREMADWELEVQADDGGIMQGRITQTPRRSIAFNTAMVMHGWLDLHAATGEETYLEAAARGADWLVRAQDADGSWQGAASHNQIPHTYKSRVCWAMLRVAQVTGEDAVRESAVRGLDWVLAQQRENGWFEHCNFEPGTLPNTHGIAYTLRGLLESSALTGDDRYLEAARRGSTALMDRMRSAGRLMARWDAGWQPQARSECLTGTVQLGGVWLRLYELTGEEGYREAGLHAVEQAAAHQHRGRWPDARGALPGSFPVYGRYAPLAFPNWATKFLADSLLVRERVTAVVAGAPAG